MARVEFPGSGGALLSGEIDRPAGRPRAWALFVHCFICGKGLPAAAMIARTLAAEGIAVLRFDFTGLGESGGDFSRSNFSSNVADLLAAARWLEESEAAPQLLLATASAAQPWWRPQESSPASRLSSPSRRLPIRPMSGIFSDKG